VFCSFSSTFTSCLVVPDPPRLDVGDIPPDGHGRVLADGGNRAGGDVVAERRVVGAKSDSTGESSVVGPCVSLGGASRVQSLRDCNVGDVHSLNGDVLLTDRGQRNVSDPGVNDTDEISPSENAVIAKQGGVVELGTESGKSGVYECVVLVGLEQVGEEGERDVLPDDGGNLGQDGRRAVDGPVGDVERRAGNVKRSIGTVVRGSGLQAGQFPGKRVLSKDGLQSAVGHVVFAQVGGAS